MKQVIIIGASGHGKVVADIVEKSGVHLLGFLDDASIGNVYGYKVLGRIEDYKDYISIAEFVIAIGNNKTRAAIASKLCDTKWYTAIHPNAQIAKDITIGVGTVVMANVVINASSTIGKHCIINTGAIVEHDNVIEDGVHLSPRVVLGGTVKVGYASHIGIGAVVRNNISIESDCVIGAGAVVVKNIDVHGTYVGVPASRVF